MKRPLTSKELHAGSTGGFTLLELVTVLAIIATATLFAIPAFQEWGARRSFDTAVNDVFTNISDARMEAFTRNTTARIRTTRSGDDYTIRIFYSDTAVSSCGSSGTWTQVKQTVIELNTRFQITGSGIGDVCFYRDGTSSGGIYNIVQKDGSTNFGAGSINVILSTGFIDVTKN